MKNNNDSELEKLENWDTNQAEVRQPQKPSRVVFSVAFQRDDFDRVSKYAELSGKKTSEFIREAAIEKTMAKGELLFKSGSQETSWLIFRNEMAPLTVASGSPSEFIYVAQ